MKKVWVKVRTMQYHGYEFELEMAHRRMVEDQRQAEHDGLVKELKKLNREENVSLWRRLVGYSLIKLGRRIARVSINSLYPQQKPLNAIKED